MMRPSLSSRILVTGLSLRDDLPQIAHVIVRRLLGMQTRRQAMA